MIGRAFNLLFLCTRNSSRSILAESILNGEAHGRFRAFSAGSHPIGTVHPLALTTLRDMGYRAEGFRSKSWDEFISADAPMIDYVVTVCDDVAGEICPVMRGPARRTHWSVEDPAQAGPTVADQQRAFAETAFYLKSRISALLRMPFESAPSTAVEEKLKRIGAMAGATKPYLRVV